MSTIIQPISLDVLQKAVKLMPETKYFWSMKETGYLLIFYDIKNLRTKSEKIYNKNTKKMKQILLIIWYLFLPFSTSCLLNQISAYKRDIFPSCFYKVNIISIVAISIKSWLLPWHMAKSCILLFMWP